MLAIWYLKVRIIQPQVPLTKWYFFRNFNRKYVIISRFSVKSLQRYIRTGRPDLATDVLTPCKVRTRNPYARMWFSIVLTTTSAINCGYNKSNGFGYDSNYGDSPIVCIYIQNICFVQSPNSILEFFKKISKILPTFTLIRPYPAYKKLITQLL